MRLTLVLTLCQAHRHVEQWRVQVGCRRQRVEDPDDLQQAQQQYRDRQREVAHMLVDIRPVLGAFEVAWATFAT